MGSGATLSFFFRLLEEEQLDFIVMGHHLNDRLETFIINLSKASGITGLSGIRKTTTKYSALYFILQKQISINLRRKMGLASGRITPTKAEIISVTKSVMTFRLKWRKQILIFGKISIKVFLFSIRQKLYRGAAAKYWMTLLFLKK